MATFTRYVDINQGAGNGSARDASAYASLSSAEANIIADTGGASTDTYIIKCAGSNADTTSATFNFSLTGAGNITIMGDDAATDSDGKYNGNLTISTGHYRLTNSSTSPLKPAQQNMTIDGIQIEVGSGLFNCGIDISGGVALGTAYFRVKNCRIRASAATDSGIGSGSSSINSDGEITYSDNLIVGFNAQGIEIFASNFRHPTCSFTQNTIYGDGTSIGIKVAEGGSNTGATYVTKGNALANHGTGGCFSIVPVLGVATYAQNCCDSAEGTTTEVLITTAVWTSPGTTQGSDFSAVAASAIINVVTPQLTTTDINGNARGSAPNEAGCFEFIAAGTSLTPLVGSLILAGITPGIINPVLITPSIGTLALAGIVSTLNITLPRTPGVGSLNFGSPFCDALDFPGDLSVYLSRSDFIGGTIDSNKGIVSCWFRIDGGDGTFRSIAGNSDGYSASYYLRVTSSNKVEFTGVHIPGYAPTNIQAVSSTSVLAGSGWHHIAIAWDGGTGAVKLYLDGVSDLAGGATIASDNTRWSGGGFSQYICIDWNGCIAELYMNALEYLDISVAANLAKLRNTDNTPATINSDASSVTGTAPLVYLHLDSGETVNNFALNTGTGGNYTTTGTQVRCSTSPSLYGGGNPSPTLNFGIFGSVGSLVLAGVAPSNVQGFLRSPTVGALVLTGVAGSLIRGTIQTPLVGSLVLSGVAGRMDLGVFPAVGGLTLTGIASTLSISGTGNTNITTVVGSLTLSGIAGRMDYGLLGTAGILALTGATPSNDRGIISTVGALALTGIVGRNDRGIITTVGALTLTGNFPQTGGNVQLQPATAALLFATAAVVMDYGLRTTVGALTLAGVASTAQRGTIIGPQVGAISLVGVSGRLNFGLFPSTGVLVFESLVSLNTGLTPLTGVLVLTGFAPDNGSFQDVDFASFIILDMRTDRIVLDGKTDRIVV